MSRLIDADALIAQMKADAEQMEDPIAEMFTYAAINDVKHAPTIEPDCDVIPKDKYEYHYDHTDCIWYRPEARNRCPTTCAQYRDGWNDAMNYIFRDGKGYRPYRRDKKYESD